MAHNSELPCDGDGVCMVCKKKPSEEDTLTCKTCNTPWHVPCLSSPPETLVSTLQWDCPDCSTDHSSAPQPVPVAAKSAESGDLLASIRAIEADASLTEEQKAKKRQDLMSRGVDHEEEEKVGGGGGEVFDLFDGSLNCSFCMQLPERPVTTPCGHNFCLKCFQKWIGLGHKTCAKCRHAIPPKMASQPRINASLVVAIRVARMARMSKSGTTTREPLKVYNFLHNQNLPDTAFVTERAKKAGKANACSGKIFVTVPADHFGPILADNDPVRNQGVLVGECWEDRLECRQWGTHLPHVAGIAGQSKYGAQSVALSGGYEDDEDHGEWFLYTGSGGRDLSGNKRTNKEQSFDQKFEKSNEALRVSCKNGYPVRVVRSHKEKRSSYAPEGGVRYDGIYRIEKCWRKVGIQGFKVCRYLFVRCDNEPAPWTSDEHGDKPRALPAIKELKKATDITNRKEDPSWDYDEVECCWKWKKTPPTTRAMSRKPIDDGDLEEMKSVRIAAKQEQTLSVRVKNLSVREKVLKEFSCLICRKVMTLPVTTPCAHNFCKHCLEGAFAGQTFLKERKCDGRRTLRTQKNIMKCPSCTMDISDFLQDLQINRELMGVIESLRSKTEENVEEAEDNVEDSSKEESDGTDENVEEAEDNVEKLSKDESDGTEKKSEACVEKMDISTESFEALKVCNKAIQNKLEEKKAGGEEKEKPSRKKKAGGEEKEKPSRKKKAGTDDNVEEGEDNVEKLSKDENDGTEKKAEACVEKMKIITEGFEVLKVRNKAIQNKLEEKKAGGEEKPSWKKKASGEQKEKPSRKKADAVIGDKKDDEMPDSAKEELHTPTTRSRQKRKLADSDCGGSTGGVRTRSMKAKELVDEGKQPHKRKKADHPASVSKSGKVKTTSNKS